MLRRILLAAAVCAGMEAEGQAVAVVTKVYAVPASYTDARVTSRSPATLGKILRKVSAFYTEGSDGKHEFVSSQPCKTPESRMNACESG